MFFCSSSNVGHFINVMYSELMSALSLGQNGPKDAFQFGYITVENDRNFTLYKIFLAYNVSVSRSRLGLEKKVSTPSLKIDSLCSTAGASSGT